jgi:flagellar hook-basal body complex protein FliE
MSKNYSTYLIYIGITAVILIIFYFINKKETDVIEAKKGGINFSAITKPMKKGMDAAKKQATKTMGTMKKGFNGVLKKSMAGMKKLGDQAKKQAKAAISKMNSITKKITSTMTGVFNKIKSTFTGMFAKITGFFNQIKQFFVCVADAFKAIGDNIKCGIDKIVNFPFCFIFYIFDCIYGIFKVLFFILGVIFPFINEPVKEMFKMLEGLVKDINDTFKESTGDTILYPGSIMKRCYYCNTTPFPDFSRPSRCGKKPTQNVPSKPIEYTNQNNVDSQKKNSSALTMEEIIGMIVGVIMIIISIVFFFSVTNSFEGGDDDGDDKDDKDDDYVDADRDGRDDKAAFEPHGREDSDDHVNDMNDYHTKRGHEIDTDDAKEGYMNKGRLFGRSHYDADDDINGENVEEKKGFFGRLFDKDKEIEIEDDQEYDFQPGVVDPYEAKMAAEADAAASAASKTAAAPAPAPAPAPTPAPAPAPPAPAA